MPEAAGCNEPDDEKSQPTESARLNGNFLPGFEEKELSFFHLRESASSADLTLLDAERITAVACM
jgi:hypothetical protein